LLSVSRRLDSAVADLQEAKNRAGISSPPDQIRLARSSFEKNSSIDQGKSLEPQINGKSKI
jgi:hypothetical protein